MHWIVLKDSDHPAREVLLLLWSPALKISPITVEVCCVKAPDLFSSLVSQFFVLRLDQRLPVRIEVHASRVACYNAGQLEDLWRIATAVAFVDETSQQAVRLATIPRTPISVNSRVAPQRLQL